MDAMNLLKRQHKEMNDLFDAFEKFDKHNDDKAKQSTFEQIADYLAIHTTIEESYFYPAARAQGTKEELAEAYDEHSEVKRLLLHAMKSTDHPGFSGLVAAIRGGLQHHIHEEENQLFPKVKKLLDKAQLDDIGAKMDKLAQELRTKGNARKNIKLTPAPAPA